MENLSSSAGIATLLWIIILAILMKIHPPLRKTKIDWLLLLAFYLLILFAFRKWLSSM